MNKKICLSSEFGNHLGQEVTVQGWLHTVRHLGNISFLILRDRHGLVQAIIDQPEQKEKLQNLQTGTILKIQGEVNSSPSELKFELQKVQLEIVEPVTEIAPVDISKKKLNLQLDTLLENRVITLRHPVEQSLFRLYAGVQKQIRNYLNSIDCTEICTPKIIAAPTEGGAEIFEMEYFGRKVCLAQSPQFYKQIMVGVFDRVYEIGKAYRAEQSHTARHMTEINMLDVEIGFLDGLEDLLQYPQELLKEVVDKIWEENLSDMNKLEAKKPLLSDKFPCVTFSDLHKLYLEKTGKDLTGERDVSPEEEKFICEYAAENWQSEAVFITDFPWSDAKFYHKQNKKNPNVAERADLLFRGVEIATISMRESNYQKLLEQMTENGLDPEHEGFKYYLQAFKYGLPPHGGFGLGIARLVQKIAGLANVKEAELFPRDTRRVTP